MSSALCSTSGSEGQAGRAAGLAARALGRGSQERSGNVSSSACVPARPGAGGADDPARSSPAAPGKALACCLCMHACVLEPHIGFCCPPRVRGRGSGGTTNSACACSRPPPPRSRCSRPPTPTRAAWRPTARARRRARSPAGQELARWPRLRANMQRRVGAVAGCAYSARAATCAVLPPRAAHACQGAARRRERMLP